MAQDLNSIDMMSFDDMEPATETAPLAEEVSAELSKYNPEDILKFMVDGGFLPAETSLLTPGESETEEAGEMGPQGAEMAGLEDMNFAGM